MTNISNPAAAANAYQAIQKSVSNVGSYGASDGASDTTKPAFASMLEDVTRSAINTVREGEKASAAGITGTMDPLAITQAVTAARITLDTFTAVRDQAVDAYNKIQGMPI